MDGTQVPEQRTGDEEPASRCALYRFYAIDGTLLYIGITQELPTRLRTHDRKQPWYCKVARITVEHFATRVEALEAEAAAIRAEGPLYNVVHNWGETMTTPAAGRGSGPGLRRVTRKENYDMICAALHGVGTGKISGATYLKLFHDGKMIRETHGHGESGWFLAEAVEISRDAGERDAAVAEIHRLHHSGGVDSCPVAHARREGKLPPLLSEAA
jgi:predicted GIY-YIG superfamily endonuclease